MNNEKKVWVDTGFIDMTIDLPNKELKELSKVMDKVPKSLKVESYENDNKTKVLV